MFGAVLFLLTALPVQVERPSAPVLPAGTTIGAIASAEVLRVGSVSGEAGPQDIVGQRRALPDGRVLVEFR